MAKIKVFELDGKGDLQETLEKLKAAGLLPSEEVDEILKAIDESDESEDERDELTQEDADTAKAIECDDKWVIEAAHLVRHFQNRNLNPTEAKLVIGKFITMSAAGEIAGIC